MDYTRRKQLNVSFFYLYQQPCFCATFCCSFSDNNKKIKACKWAVQSKPQIKRLWRSFNEESMNKVIKDERLQIKERKKAKLKNRSERNWAFTMSSDSLFSFKTFLMEWKWFLSLPLSMHHFKSPGLLNNVYCRKYVYSKGLNTNTCRLWSLLPQEIITLC